MLFLLPLSTLFSEKKMHYGIIQNPTKYSVYLNGFLLKVNVTDTVIFFF